jgi:hypothetical protein
MDFDLSQLELSDTAMLTLKNARGDGDLIGADGINPAQIELFSPGSPEGVKALASAGRKSQLRMSRAMRGDTKDTDAREAERDNAEKLAAFTKTLINLGSVQPIQIYSNPRLCYITQQAEHFIAKYANFSKGSSAS